MTVPQFVMLELPRSSWPTDAGEASGVRREAVFRGGGFLAQLFTDRAEGAAGTVWHRLTVCRDTMGDNGRWLDGITWDELQAVKAAVGCGGLWAVEVYPAEGHVVDVANMRHLWLFVARPPFAWRGA